MEGGQNRYEKTGRREWCSEPVERLVTSNMGPGRQRIGCKCIWETLRRVLAKTRKDKNSKAVIKDSTQGEKEEEEPEKDMAAAQDLE